MTESTVDEPFMPEREAALLKEVYSQAKVILEYGSGGSTQFAASLPEKYIMSVESDRDWARELRSKIGMGCSRNVIFHVDIGATGSWGRPINTTYWRRYHLYPNLIWSQSWFRHPDTVLIDGRFRTACLATILLQAKSHITVLFDDYAVRPRYRQIERIIQPNSITGRMAVFSVEPGMVKREDMGFLIQQYFTMTVHGVTEDAYLV